MIRHSHARTLHGRCSTPDRVEIRDDGRGTGAAAAGQRAHRTDRNEPAPLGGERCSTRDLEPGFSPRRGVAMSDDPIRLLLADDQALVRGALSALLGLERDLEVVAEVSSGDQVLDAVREHRPDVALLDVEMPGLDGIEADGGRAQRSSPTYAC